MTNLTRRLARTALATTMLIGVAGAAQSQETISIMGWAGLFDFQKAGWERIVSEFEAQNPGVTIEYIATPFEDTLNQATIAILGNNAPDVLQIMSTWVPQFHEMGALEPLNEHIDAETIAKFPEGSRESVTFDGDVLALSWIPGPIQMGYNRNLLERAGLDPDDPPATWAEFTEAVEKVCALEGEEGADMYGVALRTSRNSNTAHWALPIIWANGGEFVDEDGRIDFTGDAVVKTFEWYRDVVQSGCSPDAFDIQASRNLFAQGRAGFIFEGPWLRGLVNNLSGGNMTVAADGDVWIAPMPANENGEVRQISNSNMLAMSAQSDNKELAAKFIDFVLGNRETVEYYYETSKQLTTGRLDILSSGAMGADDYVQQIVAALPVSQPVPIQNAQWNAVMDVLAGSLQAVIRGADARDELARAQREIDRMLGQ